MQQMFAGTTLKKSVSSHIAKLNGEEEPQESDHSDNVLPFVWAERWSEDESDNAQMSSSPMQTRLFSICQLLDF